MVKIPRSVILLGLVSLINDASSEMILPILPMYIATLGGGAMAMGVIGSVADAVASFIKAFSGYLSDKFDSRKPLVIGGYSLSAFSKTGYFFASIWPHVLFLRIGDRIGKGLRSAPRDALVGAVTPKNIRGRAYGFHRMMDSAGAILGSFMVLAFLYWVNLDIKTILVIAGPISFLTLIPLFFVKDTKSNVKKISSGFFSELHLLPKDFKLSMIPVSLFYLGNFTYMFFIMRAMAKLSAIGDGTLLTIALYVLFNLFYTFSSYPLGALSDKVGRKSVIMLGYFLFAMTCAGFAYASTLAHFIIFFALYGIFNATIEGNEKAFAVDLAAGAKGTALGAFYATEGLMTLPSGLIAGYLWETISPETTFAFGAVMALVAIVVLHVLVRPETSKSKGL